MVLCCVYFQNEALSKLENSTACFWRGFNITYPSKLVA